MSYTKGDGTPRKKREVYGIDGRVGVVLPIVLLSIGRVYVCVCVSGSQWWCCNVYIFLELFVPQELSMKITVLLRTLKRSKTEDVKIKHKKEKIESKKTKITRN